VGANGTPLDVVGQIKVPVKIGSYQSEQVFTVVNTLTVDCLLGADYLISQEVIIDYKHSYVVIKGHKIPFTLTQGVANTIHPPTNLVVSALRNVTIPGRTIQLVDVLLPDALSQQDLNGILIEPSETIKLPQHVIAARTISPVLNGNQALIQVINVSPAPVTIYKNTRVGDITPLSELLTVDATEQPLSQSAPLNVDLTDSSDQQAELHALLDQYSDLFATKEQALGQTSAVKHTIYTQGPPIRQPVRCQPAVLQQAIDTEVNKMLQQGIIQQSFSPWSSPVVMVRKKDGSWQFCVDYRKLNDVTHRDAYPLPRIDTTLDSLAGSTLFTTLDLASGYWQVEVDPVHKEKTAFSTSQGHYEFNVMPFGLTNAPATFQRLMECTLAGLSGIHCLIYLDDIIVFSTNFADHLSRLSSVFDRLRTGCRFTTEAGEVSFCQNACHLLRPYYFQERYFTR